MEPLAIALSRTGRGLEWGDGGGDLISKAIQNCHNESPLFSKYILIKMENNKLGKRLTTSKSKVE
jgi:hypothetical protein